MFRRYRKWEQGEFVVVWCDTATGLGDYCAGQFLSNKKLDVPLVYHSKETATVMTPLIHNELERIKDETGIQPVVAFERNNGGGFEMDRLASLNRLGKYRIYTMKTLDSSGRLDDSSKLGWDTNTATRPKMLQDLKEAIDKQLLRIYDKPTVNEMFSFIIKTSNSSVKAQAETGAHDDLIMSLAGAWQLYQTEKPILHDMDYIDDERIFDDEGFMI
jgi:hypothetical protein